MARHPDPNPSKAALYQRKWRAKNPPVPRPPNPNKDAKLQIEALWGEKLGVHLNKAEVYREKQKQRWRWSSVLKAERDLIFSDRGVPVTYSYADALYRRDNKPVKTATPQAEYQRRYRAKRKAELPESVALPRILEHLPEHLHETLHNLLDSVRRCPKPVPVPVQEPKPEPKQEPAPAPITLEQRHLAVLKAGHDLTFEGVVYYHEDALWWASRK
jgi:hypothetical protein